MTPQARILAYILRYKWLFIVGMICAAVSAGIALYVAQIIKQLFEAMEKGSQAGARQALSVVCLTAVALYLINWFFTFGQTYFLSAATNAIAADLRNDIYRHIQSMPLSFFTRTRTGHIISRVSNDVGLIQNGAGVVIQMVRAPLTIVGGLIFMFTVSWTLSLVAILVVPFMALLISRVGRRVRKLTSVLQVSLADLTASLEEAMIGMRVIKSFGTEDYEIDKFARQNADSLRAAMKSVKRSAAVSPTIDVLGITAGAGVIWWGASIVQAGAMTTAELMQFLVLVNLVASSARQIGHVNVVYNQTMAGTERILQVLDEKSDLVEAEDAIELPPVQGSVVFQDVSFNYSEDTPVLSDVSFAIEPGKSVAVVGPSGAGKSTIANLIPRFYDVCQGSVLVDGVDVRTVTLDSLRSQIGIVPQETILFTGAVRENICYGAFDATDEEVVEAAKAAHAHDFILSLPDGYDTLVGERGLALSGGERQRISIARALLRDPKILILDEATSSLDAASESLVQEALERLMQGRTTLVIAHRLSTITKADSIVVLQNGRVVEKGKFQDLLAQQGLFYTLYNTQFCGQRNSELLAQKD